MMIDIDDGWCLMIDAEDDWWWLMSLVAGLIKLSIFDENQILQIYTSFEWLALYPQRDPLKGALRHLGHPSRVSLNKKGQRWWVCQVVDMFVPYSQVDPRSRSSMKEKLLQMFCCRTRLLQMYGIYPFEWLI